jgi:hypothetical protein
VTETQPSLRKLFVLSKKRTIDKVQKQYLYAWLIRRILDLIIEFIGPLYNWLKQFANYCLTHSHLLRFDTPLLRCTPFSSSDCALLQLLCTDPKENTVFCCQKYVFIGPLPSDGCPSIVVRIFFGICLPSRCLAMGICTTILIVNGSCKELEFSNHFATFLLRQLCKTDRSGKKCLLSFHTTWTTSEKKKIMWDTQTKSRCGDLTSLLLFVKIGKLG